MTTGSEERFDIVIVGAGASGAVVAARASEDPNRTVALLDAGPDYTRAVDLPTDLRDGYDNSYVDHDWGLGFTPVDGRGSDRFPRGRVTGGSSAVNTTIALRGVPDDYDTWAERGCPEWAWSNVLPAFNRLERDLDFGSEPHHGDSGPISIKRATIDELLPHQQAFIDAARSFGHPACADANHPDDWGVGPLGMNRLGRLRISTAIGYLAPARYRDNLTIHPDATARRLVLDGRRAVGVEVESAVGDVSVVYGRTVVLAAGAIHTPGILVRSGIGRRDELAALGIDEVAEVPGVGANLADHPALAVVCELRDGELADPELPLIQTITRYTSEGSDRRLDVNVELITRAQLRRGGPKSMLLAPSLEWVEGRGEIRQTSADATSLPSIEPHFGEHPADIARHAAALADAIEIAHQPSLRDFWSKISFPDPDRSSPTDLAAVASKFATSGYHPCGTARMGPADDPTTVVDQYGRSHAIDGLVVADASIMPTVPRANTNLTSIMIGETIGEWFRTNPARYGL